MSGFLGSIIGETNAAQKARLDDASEGAKDLTKLVKKRKLVAEAQCPPSDLIQTNDKRKPDSGEREEEILDIAGAAKKARSSNGAA